jgi:mRNA interferase RelE/StbE
MTDSDPRYEIDFLETAKKEWDKLGHTIRQQFKKKLAERQQSPHILSARLSGLPDCYKIKLSKSGYRLVYRVFDDCIVIQVIAVGKRERNEAYKDAAARL